MKENTKFGITNCLAGCRSLKYTCEFIELIGMQLHNHETA